MISVTQLLPSALSIFEYAAFLFVSLPLVSSAYNRRLDVPKTPSTVWLDEARVRAGRPHFTANMVDGKEIRYKMKLSNRTPAKPGARPVVSFVH